MKWLVFSYSLPSKLTTASRVRIWRKLRKSGAVSPKAGVYVLPYTEACLDAARWLATEVEQEQGEAIVMQVDRFENMPDEKVIDIFRNERAADYQKIEAFMAELEQLIQAAQEKNQNNVVAFKRDINKVRKEIEEVSRVDFFLTQEKRRLLDRLHSLQRTLMTGNLILMVLFSLGTLNDAVLRKMKEEYEEIPYKEFIKVKTSKRQIETTSS